MEPNPPAASDLPPPEMPPKTCPSTFCTEDWWAIWLGGIILLLALGGTWLSRPSNHAELAIKLKSVTQELDTLEAEPQRDATAIAAKKTEREKIQASFAVNPWKPWLAKIGSWSTDPLKAFNDKNGKNLWPGLAGVFLVCVVLFGIGIAGLGDKARAFPLAFAAVFLLAIFAYVLAGQKVIKHFNLEYALWAILAGLIISNTIGTPRWMRPAIRTEFYIKTGLVLLGAEILFNRLLSLGIPGICVSWIVTPVVLISTYIFGQRILKMPSRSLNMVISADMSVCGVSAAIATGAACRAKREELSLAIALSLGFTVIMMVVMPAAIKILGMSEVLGGAWIGGTIDSTGAVAAAGGMLGETALTVAATVKMIQNILIGAVAFGVAVYWVGWVERTDNTQRPSLWEIWHRFPKFMLGFIGASILFSSISATGPEGQAIVSAATTGTSEVLRGWLFCLAFVSIGLETNFRELSPYFKGGKPLILYVCGQTLNLVLTLFMAWLMFEKIFPNAADALSQ